MNIKNHYGKILNVAAMIVASLAAQAMAAEVKQATTTAIKTTITQTELLVKDQDAISRSEVVANGLPLNSDVYFLGEIQGKNELYKLRAQTLPLSYGLFSLGISGQHVEQVSADKVVAHEEMGIVGRIMGKPSESTFAKADMRYFPSENMADSYAFLGSKRIFLDELSSYNPETQQAMLRLGIDYKINKNFSIGIEEKFSGSIQDLRAKYTAIRAKATF